MIQKVKKGPLKYCVTVLILLILSGITQPSYTMTVEDNQETVDNSIAPQTEGEDTPNENEQETNETDEINNDDETEEESSQDSLTVSRRISNIIIHGNTSTSKEAIINHVPYKVGELFDMRKTKTLIRNLYYKLKKFRTIKVMAEIVDKNSMNLHIIVEEKVPLKELITVGKRLKKKYILKR